MTETVTLILAMTFPTFMAWAYFIAAPAGPAMPALYAVGKILQFGGPLVYLAVTSPAELRPRRPTFCGVGLGTAFGLFTAVGILWTFHVLLADHSAQALAAERIRLKVTQLGVETPAKFLALAAFLTLIHSGLEEYYWRWFVHGRLRRRLPFAVATVLSSLAFAAHHAVILAVYLPGHFWTLAVPMSLAIAVGGAAWAWLWERSGSLLGPWLSHLIVDAALMAVGFRLIFAA